MAASGSSPLDLPPGGPLSLSAPSQPSSSNRRLPPPCWSHDETVALIDSYKEKWYSLRRGNLKATHWQEVADAVSNRCPAVTLPKTAVQCRHKMEKLRKRYRTELQRARSMPVSRFTSSWVHFKRMDSMEKGPSADGDNSDSGDDDNDEEDEEHDQVLYEDDFRNGNANTKNVHKLYGNGIGSSNGGGGGGGFRIRIPTGVSIAQPGSSSKLYGKVDQKFNSNPNHNHNPNFNSSPGFGTRILKDCNAAPAGVGNREREPDQDQDPVGEMVAAIKVLADGFVKMEQMKMNMAREFESNRMEMEMKRTEMILKSQQQIVESFAKAVSEKKKVRRFSSPES